MELENKDSIPANVMKQAEEAEKLHRQLYPDQYPETEEEPKPGEEPPKENEPPKEAAPQEQVPPQMPKEEPPPQERTEDWKQKYEILQGKYNAEVPQLHMSVASLQNLLKQVQAEMESIKAAKEAAPAPKEPEKKEASPHSKFVATLKDEYPDIYEAVSAMIAEARLAQAPAGSPANPGSAGPTPPSPQAPQTVNPRATFDFYLNRDVPDWQKVNVDPEFLRFLEAPDPNFPGMTKMQSIQSACDAMDFTTVVGHFRDFKAANGSQSQPNPNPRNPNPGPSSPAEKYLAPPRGGQRGAAPSSGPAVTPADVAKFYNQASKGLWGPQDGEKFRKEEARLLTVLMKSNQ